MAEIYLLNTNDKLAKNKYQDFYSKLTDYRRNKIEKYKFEADAKRSLYSAMLLQYIIMHKYSVTNDEFEVAYNTYGKPYILGKKDWKFNISHSGEWVICGWSNKEIGVDIEQIKDMDIKIAQRFFTPNEYAYLCKFNKEIQNHKFFELWTLKESYIKYKGKGLSIPLDSFEFNLKELPVVLKSELLLKPYFHQYHVQDEYKMTICCRESERPLFKIITSQQIWKMICSYK